MVDVEGDDGHGRGEGDQADGDAVVEGWNVRMGERHVEWFVGCDNGKFRRDQSL